LFFVFPFLFFLSACSTDYNAPIVYAEEFLAPLVDKVVVEENEANIEVALKLALLDFLVILIYS